MVLGAVDQDVDPKGVYELQVLTVSMAMPGIDLKSLPPSLVCQV